MRGCTPSGTGWQPNSHSGQFPCPIYRNRCGTLTLHNAENLLALDSRLAAGRDGEACGFTFNWNKTDWNTIRSATLCKLEVWRKRVGVEPTIRLARAGSPALKAGRITGPHSPPELRRAMVTQGLVHVSRLRNEGCDGLGASCGVSWFLCQTPNSYAQPLRQRARTA
jgi:hypothetical protein